MNIYVNCGALTNDMIPESEWNEFLAQTHLVDGWFIFSVDDDLWQEYVAAKEHVHAMKIKVLTNITEVGEVK